MALKNDYNELIYQEFFKLAWPARDHYDVWYIPRAVAAPDMTKDECKSLRAIAVAFANRARSASRARALIGLVGDLSQ